VPAAGCALAGVAARPAVAATASRSVAIAPSTALASRYRRAGAGAAALPVRAVRMLAVRMLAVLAWRRLRSFTVSPLTQECART
jgi:hypothetical protein